MDTKLFSKHFHSFGNAQYTKAISRILFAYMFFSRTLCRLNFYEPFQWDLKDLALNVIYNSDIDIICGLLFLFTSTFKNILGKTGNFCRIYRYREHGRTAYTLYRYILKISHCLLCFCGTYFLGCPIQGKSYNLHALGILLFAI
jgi:hypothetical protein